VTNNAQQLGTAIEQPAPLADHGSKAANQEKALHYSLLAAKEAAKVYARPEAIRWAQLGGSWKLELRNFFQGCITQRDVSVRTLLHLLTTATGTQPPPARPPSVRQLPGVKQTSSRRGARCGLPRQKLLVPLVDDRKRARGQRDCAGDSGAGISNSRGASTTRGLT
jgi:hypothetical protein